MHAINRNTSIVNHKSINLSNSDSGCTCVHGLGASPEQASRVAPPQRLAAISITQWFNSRAQKNMTAVRAARNLTEDLRRRGWGCAASTRATTRDEGGGDRTGGLLQRVACCAFCRTAGGHHDEQRGRGLTVWGGGVAQRRCTGRRPWRGSPLELRGGGFLLFIFFHGRKWGMLDREIWAQGKTRGVHRGGRSGHGRSLLA
jgi:hypothetical protein